MNTQQAKFILQGYRPNGADAGDEAFGEALEQVRNDPGLHEWFAREQAFDSLMAAKLGEVPAPAGLREAILAGGRVTAPSPAGRPWWRQAGWLGVAAGVALLFALAMTWWTKAAAASGALTEFALTDARHSETHGGHGAETGALQAVLNQPTTRLSDRLPVDFAALRKAGCRTLSFHDHEILEVCFKRNGAWFHCYIAQRGDFPAMAAEAPVLTDRSSASIATWADAAYLYVVVSKTGRAALERLL